MEKESFQIRRPALPGKYRRAFNWRFSFDGEENSQKSYQQCSAIMGLGISEGMAVLEDYLYLSRKRLTNRTAMARLMSHLIGEHLASEYAISQFKQELDSQSAGPKSETSQDDILQTERRIQEERLYINALRVIGDGIAWRAFDYDRVVMHVLSNSRAMRAGAKLGHSTPRERCIAAE